jgi:hypothetical protein
MEKRLIMRKLACAFATAVFTFVVFSAGRDPPLDVRGFTGNADVFNRSSR